MTMMGKVIFNSRNGFRDIPFGLISGKKFAFFDMDGTLVNMERSNYTLYKDILMEMYKLELTSEEWRKEFTGRIPQDSIPDFLKRMGDAEKVFNMERFVVLAKPKKEDIIFNRLFENSCLVESAKNFLRKLEINGIHMILTTSTIKIFTESILEQYNLKHYFDKLITGEDVKTGKPNPQIYLFASEISGVAPSEIVVFEDSNSGVKAAVDAGLDCILISRSKNIMKSQIMRI